MDREAVIRMAREAGFDPHDMSDDFSCNLVDIERFATLVAAAEREKVAQWMMAQGYSTGHGDSTEDLLKELEWQIEERIKNEREAIAKSLDKQADLACDEIDRQWAQEMAAAVRARGNT
jgi:hypothetical protein